MEGDATKKQLKKLRKSSSLFVRDVLTKDLERAAKVSGLDKFLEIIPDPDGVGDSTYLEPRKIHIYYQSLFERTSGSYLRDEIQLEVGSRLLFEPTSSAKVNYL